MNRVPDRDEVTLAEINSELVTLSGPDDPNLERYARAEGTIYAPTYVPAFVTFPTRQRKVERPLGLKQPIKRDPWLVWLEEMGQKIDFCGPTQLVNMAYELLDESFLAPVRSVLGRKPSDNTFLVNLLESLEENSIRCIAWHPYRPILAVAHRADIIYLYDVKNEAWSTQVLVHEFQKDITCIEWKPRAGGVLAVGCRNGICLWKVNVDPADAAPPNLGSTKTTSTSFFSSPRSPSAFDDTQRSHLASASSSTASTPRAVWMNFLRYPGYVHISTLSWDPSSCSHLLVVGSAVEGTLLVWDTSVETAVPLRRLGGETAFVKWSPDGAFVFVASAGRYMRLWETRTWTSQQFINPSGKNLKTACWTLDGRSLFYTLNEEGNIYVLHILKPAPLFECKRMVVYAASHEPEIVSLSSGRTVSVGGEICQLSIDPVTGERLVVSYEYSNLIAVFLVRPQAGVVVNQDGWILHSGYIRGPYWADKPIISEPDGESKRDPHAVCMAFAPQFLRGALLAIAWENGALTFVPFCFMSEKAVRERGGSSAESFRATVPSAPGFGRGWIET
ncbi:WD40-repeat-containing domain protein [Endogone sp. FLAS-F59071]|nr:WD40-repeat-containing domain protein [Endogone sp. FLAS-F59071]|eukprot:RUS22848.1 WD40-repeat-containing domain protein [Endogone sp. FLAS-F59071]